jgi:branched-subunit amino acid transport protein
VAVIAAHKTANVYWTIGLGMLTFLLASYGFS